MDEIGRVEKLKQIFVDGEKFSDGDYDFVVLKNFIDDIDEIIFFKCSIKNK